MPATKAIPKAMIPIVDRPTVQYVVDEALASGIEEILIIISPNGEPVKHHFDDKPNIKFVVQTEARGLGAAIGLARDFCAGESFAVLLGDDVVYNAGRTALGQLITKNLEDRSLEFKLFPARKFRAMELRKDRKSSLD